MQIHITKITNRNKDDLTNDEFDDADMKNIIYDQLTRIYCYGIYVEKCLNSFWNYKKSKVFLQFLIFIFILVFVYQNECKQTRQISGKGNDNANNYSAEKNNTPGENTNHVEIDAEKTVDGHKGRKHSENTEGDRSSAEEPTEDPTSPAKENSQHTAKLFNSLKISTTNMDKKTREKQKERIQKRYRKNNYDKEPYMSYYYSYTLHQKKARELEIKQKRKEKNEQNYRIYVEKLGENEEKLKILNDVLGGKEAYLKILIDVLKALSTNTENCDQCDKKELDDAKAFIKEEISKVERLIGILKKATKKLEK